MDLLVKHYAILSSSLRLRDLLFKHFVAGMPNHSYSSQCNNHQNIWQHQHHFFSNVPVCHMMPHIVSPTCGYKLRPSFDQNQLVQLMSPMHLEAAFVLVHSLTDISVHVSNDISANTATFPP